MKSFIEKVFVREIERYGYFLIETVYMYSKISIKIKAKEIYHKIQEF